MKSLIPKLLLVVSTGAQALTLAVNPAVGLMQQPSSSYWHLIQGVSVNAGIFDELILLRAGFWERPQFKAAGYIDQDSGQSILLGTKLTLNSTLFATVYAGYGRVQGYIKVDPDSDKFHAGKDGRRGFAMSGPQLAMSTGIEFGSWSLSVAHELLAGLGTPEQVNAGVAWPFSLFWLETGYRW